MGRLVRTENPTDITATYNYIRIYATSSDVSDGTYNMVTSSAINTSFWATDTPGYTDINYSAGTSAMWYASTYYATATSAESDLTPAYDRLRGDTPRLRKKALQRLRDTSNIVWSNDELDSLIQNAVDALFPYFGVESKDTTWMTSTNVREYPLPSAWFRVDSMYLGTIGSDYCEYQNYYIQGKTVMFQETPVQASKPITMYGLKRFSGAWDVPLIYEDLLLFHILAEAFEMLVVDRAKFKQYAELVKDKDMRVQEIQVLANNYRALFRTKRNELEKPGQITEMRS